LSSKHDPLLKLDFLFVLSHLRKPMKLGGVALAVATKITYRFNFEKDKCWWTIKQLAEFVQCTERQVFSAINIFREKKLFFITKGHTGKANEYKPNFSIILKYPSLLDEKMRQRAVNYLSPQTINTNNKSNSLVNNNLNGWGEKSVESSNSVGDKKLSILEQKAIMMNKNMNVPSVTPQEATIMWKKKLINLEVAQRFSADIN
jgi:hypothetical protein